MNKAELIEFLARKTQMPKRKCDSFLNEFKSAISGEKVQKNYKPSNKAILLL